jgi:hypothetical protein
MFSCKNTTFGGDGKVCTGPGSAWIRIGLAPLIRIRIEVKQAGSGSALVSMRIHNTGFNINSEYTFPEKEAPVLRQTN